MVNNKKYDVLEAIDIDNKGLMQYKLNNDRKEARKNILLSILITFIVTVVGTTMALHFIDSKDSAFEAQIKALQHELKELKDSPKASTEQAK